ncbi:hypothetical protein NTGZN8_120001 [Candidatus Nitrotoga fabula]|uniref:Uncharacterized protein n=1 Tax=Candidatus Nitrotoga fabula TaxID=2182327 RepID=A0A916F819_9PROT|nr:hypothetical protein NTGZN8_120001 [Candidatus Nitrotoga fabula]
MGCPFRSCQRNIRKKYNTKYNTKNIYLTVLSNMTGIFQVPITKIQEFLITPEPAIVESRPPT